MEYFFHPSLQPDDQRVTLEKETSHHVMHVLRKQAGDTIYLTNGKGWLATASLSPTSKKTADALIENIQFHPQPQPTYSLAVAFTKNTGRNEWMVEKLTELGCHEILPIQTQRSVKTHLRSDRLKQISISAMLQSQQVWLTEVGELQSLHQLLKQANAYAHRFIAHCLEEADRQPLALPDASTLLLIGPEGDFTRDEIEAAQAEGFRPISLGHRRLRTETAAMTAAALFNIQS